MCHVRIVSDIRQLYALDGDGNGLVPHLVVECNPGRNGYNLYGSTAASCLGSNI